MMTPLSNQIKLTMTLLCLVIVVPLSAAKRLRSEEKMSLQMYVHEGVGDRGCQDGYLCAQSGHENCKRAQKGCDGVCCPPPGLDTAPKKTIFSRALGRKAGKKLAKTAFGKIVPGGSNFLSAGAAKIKSDALYALGQKLSGVDYNFKDDITTVKHAIQFVSNKKRDKAIRQTATGTAKAGTTIAITATSATVGSIIPGLGTAAGTVGGLGAGYVLSPAIFGASYLKRMAKHLYKHIQGTLGKHRDQAANVLFGAWAKYRDEPNTPDGKAAAQALWLILGDFEFEYMRQGKSASGKQILQKNIADEHAEEKFGDKWLKRICARMKSN